MKKLKLLQRYHYGCNGPVEAEEGSWCEYADVAALEANFQLQTEMFDGLCADYQTLKNENERLLKEREQIIQAVTVQKTNHIISGSIGPLYSAGFAAGTKHAAESIEAILNATAEAASAGGDREHMHCEETELSACYKQAEAAPKLAKGE